MTSRVPWSVEAIEPFVRAKAEAAARRAGMTLNNWLNFTIGDAATAPQTDANVAEIHHRLDVISCQIEQILQAAAPKQNQWPTEQIHRQAPQMAAGPDLSGFEKQLRYLTSQIEGLRRPNPTDPTIAALRNEIADIRQSITDAMPRRALESLENEIRSLARRIDESRQNGADGNMLQNIEHALREIHKALCTLTPAEQLAGFDETIRNLGGKIDMIVRANPDSNSIQKLEDAISALRTIVANVASNETLMRLSSDVHILASKVDQLSQSDGFTNSLAARGKNHDNSIALTNQNVIDAIRRELSDLRDNQSETNRNTQDALENVHDTLGHVVDRLAMIESDLVPHAPIDRNLPPESPLEPSIRLQERGTTASSLIAAARRAAQAAPSAPKDKLEDTLEDKLGQNKPDSIASFNNIASLSNTVHVDKQIVKGKGRITPKIRSLLVGVSVAVIVLSGLKMAMLIREDHESSTPAIDKPAGTSLEKSSNIAPSITPPDNDSVQSSVPEPTVPSILPSIISPTPFNRQSMNVSLAPMTISDAKPDTSFITVSPVESKPAPVNVTGTVFAPQINSAPSHTGSTRKLPAAAASLVTADKLPDAIGGPVLRSAALKGDPAAAYEVAVRFAEGKGVPVDYKEAAKWYDRAADGGVVPAMFRLGMLYEKGLSGEKDIDAAKRCYIRAAERGNAKAMHNLAVLIADGGNKGPNYKIAIEWFRKAAERGIADSQFNLGILYARGIGVEQNFSESYKWFSLAAAQGDTDSGRKRDDIAKRLDAPSLAAAKLAIQTFIIEAQPDDAINVPIPAGGWDAISAPAVASKRPAKLTNKQNVFPSSQASQAASHP